MNRYVLATAAVVTLVVVAVAVAFALPAGANHASSGGPVPALKRSAPEKKPAKPSVSDQAGVITTAARAATAAAASTRAGTWQRLPAVPIAVPYIHASVWTGTEMLIFGRVSSPKGDAFEWFDVAAAYGPATNAWRMLHPRLGRTSVGREGRDQAVWTGTEMLVTGITNAAYNPATNRWRLLPLPPLGWNPAFTVWTGRQLIGWGGGCCGDSYSWGAAYTPATDAWRKLPSAPLRGRQGTTGAWTGNELIIAGGNDAEGKIFAGTAAYNPATRSWRRLPPLPAPRTGATAVWDGSEVLIVGGLRAFGKRPYADGVAYNPSTNRWRRLPTMETGRVGHVAVWTGSQLLVWGGQTDGDATAVAPPYGLAYDPVTNRWSPLPVSPLRGRIGATAVWTGTKMIIWGGVPIGGDSSKVFADGAAYTPGTVGDG